MKMLHEIQLASQLPRTIKINLYKHNTEQTDARVVVGIDLTLQDAPYDDEWLAYYCNENYPITNPIIDGTNGTVDFVELWVPYPDEVHN